MALPKKGRDDMTRHSDKDGPENTGASRLSQFMRIEREKQPKKTTKKLQRRPEDRHDGARVRAFSEIDRRPGDGAIGPD